MHKEVFTINFMVVLSFQSILDNNYIIILMNLTTYKYKTGWIGLHKVI